MRTLLIFNKSVRLQFFKLKLFFIIIILTSLYTCKKDKIPAKEFQIVEDLKYIKYKKITAYLSPEQLLKQNLNYNDSFKINFSGLYPDYKTLPKNKYLSYTEMLLNIEGFKIINSNIWNAKKMPNNLFMTLEKDECICKISKVFDTITKKEILIKASESISCTNSNSFSKINKTDVRNHITKYGIPLEANRFNINKGLPEFRVALYNYIDQNANAEILELTWKINNLKTNRLTIWYLLKTQTWVLVNRMQWHNESEF